VLVGWDASADAAAALGIAASIIGGSEGDVVALAVLREAPRLEATDENDSQRDAIRRRADAHFAQVRQAAAGAASVRMSLKIIEDRQVGRAVCDYAAENGFHLLVLGRSGDGARLRPRLGRVAEAAARDCAIPVLLVGPR
jgi:nucleotide-binding universal stress UspA family protein